MERKILKTTWTADSWSDEYIRPFADFHPDGPKARLHIDVAHFGSLIHLLHQLGLHMGHIDVLWDGLQIVDREPHTFAYSQLKAPFPWRKDIV